MFPRRGEIWWIALYPTKGSEIKKTRPCLILSRDEYNKAASTITIIPITSGKARYPSWEVEVGKSSGLLGISHFVLAQIRVAAKERLKKRIGKIKASHFAEIQDKLLLGFDNLIIAQTRGVVLLSGGPGCVSGFSTSPLMSGDS